MKVVCVCAFGLGSSLILRMNVEEVLKKLGVKNVNVEVVDIGQARGTRPDLIVSSHSFCEKLADMGVPMIEVINYVDKNFLEEEIKQILKLQ